VREKFILEYNKSFLFASDEVIRSINCFLKSVHTEKIHTDQIKEQLFANMILTMRQDLSSSILKRCFNYIRHPLKRTQLIDNDFMHVNAN